MQKKYQFRGDLSEQPLAEMLMKIYQYRVPGVIELTHEEVVKRIYVRRGFVVYATSSELKDSLGSYLLETGMLSRDDFRRTMRERRGSKKRYGQILVDQNLLAPADLYRAVRRQTAEILWGLFRWETAQVTFSVGDYSDPAPTAIQIPLRQVVKIGVRRSEDSRGLLGRVGGKKTILKPSFEFEDLVEVALDREEYDLLTLVDGDRTLLDICADGPFDTLTNGRLLYAYWVLRLLKGRPSPSASGSIKIRLETRHDKSGATNN